MGVIGRFRPAAERFLQFMNTPMGEEVLEGVTAGGLTGLALLTSGQPIEQTALQTALAMAGGIGVGMAGRRVGAAAGRKIHPQAYADQSGMIANVSRSVGQEGVFTGMKESLSHAGGEMRKVLRTNTIDALEDAFKANPVALAKEFNMTPDKFEEILPLLRKADDVVTPMSAESIDDFAKLLKTDSQRMQSDGSQTGDVSKLIADAKGGIANILTSGSKPITGEHTGRALGRMFGDEIGVGLGLGTGALIGQQMGWESDKDRQIRLLEEQLRNYR